METNDFMVHSQIEKFEYRLAQLEKSAARKIFHAWDAALLPAIMIAGLVAASLFGEFGWSVLEDYVTSSPTETFIAAFALAVLLTVALVAYRLVHRVANASEDLQVRARMLEQDFKNTINLLDKRHGG